MDHDKSRAVVESVSSNNLKDINDINDCVEFFIEINALNTEYLSNF